MKHTLLAGVGAAALGFTSPAMAGGNILLTGHDDDYHCTSPEMLVTHAARSAPGPVRSQWLEPAGPGDRQWQLQ